MRRTSRSVVSSRSYGTSRPPDTSSSRAWAEDLRLPVTRHASAMNPCCRTIKFLPVRDARVNLRLAAPSVGMGLTCIDGQSAQAGFAYPKL